MVILGDRDRIPLPEALLRCEAVLQPCTLNYTKGSFRNHYWWRGVHFFFRQRNLDMFPTHRISRIWATDIFF